MPCNFESREEMAAAGMTEEEIALMEEEVKLARAKAEALAYETRMTAYQQKRVMDAAEKREREVAHDRFHRRQADESRAFFNAVAQVKPKVNHE